MNETAQDAWFYSRESEKIGPVTFAALKIKALEGGLNPRLDLVWTHGMGDWKPAGEIDGLFERRPADEPAPVADPYAPPQHESPAEGMGPQGQWPGARRRSFLIAILIFPAVWAFGFRAALPLLSTQFGPEIMKIVDPGANLVPFLVGLYFSLRRLVNLGMSRWWYLANLVPFLNFWLGFRLFACPAGYAYHKKLDGVGIFLAIVYWLLVAIVIAVLAAIIAVILGHLGSPDLRQQFEEILRQAIPPQS